MIRVSSQLCAHIMSSNRVGSHTFESARMIYHWIGQSGRVGSSLFESARVIFYSEQLKRATIESARQPFESARVHEFRKVLITTRFSYQILLYLLHWLYDLFSICMIEVTQMFLLYIWVGFFFTRCLNYIDIWTKIVGHMKLFENFLQNI